MMDNIVRVENASRFVHVSIRLAVEHSSSENKNPETASERKEKSDFVNWPHKELISTAKPSKLPTTSTMP